MGVVGVVTGASAAGLTDVAVAVDDVDIVVAFGPAECAERLNKEKWGGGKIS